jgi:hypothetical protein
LQPVRKGALLVSQAASQERRERHSNGNEDEMNRTYHSLTILADHPETEIWVGDAEGHFVQKGIGNMSTRLLPERYSVQFGLHDEKRWIQLYQDLEVRGTS